MLAYIVRSEIYAQRTHHVYDILYEYSTYQTDRTGVLLQAGGIIMVYMNII